METDVYVWETVYKWIFGVLLLALVVWVVGVLKRAVVGKRQGAVRERLLRWTHLKKGA